MTCKCIEPFILMIRILKTILQKACLKKTYKENNPLYTTQLNSKPKIASSTSKWSLTISRSRAAIEVIMESNCMLQVWYYWQSLEPSKHQTPASPDTKGSWEQRNPVTPQYMLVSITTTKPLETIRHIGINLITGGD